MGWAKYRNERLCSLGWIQCRLDSCIWGQSGVIALIFVDNFYFFGAQEDINAVYPETAMALTLVAEPAQETATEFVYDILSISVHLGKNGRL
ncbi:unnamed protein product [Amoebophrya sp. A120]|nr:unnamed protein product [Amoebophrya sp. A120]CAD7976654.1 unnamed protein product [Amoebophrya sp. A120]|eukprot:GSA120T00026417001.1